MNKRIFISACEASADLHCGHLMSAIKEKAAKTSTNVEFSGFGGEKMAVAGCELLENTVKKAAMIYNVLGQIGYYRRLIKQAGQYLKDNKIDLVIVCDSPAFNFHIAKAAKKVGIKTLFYVAPQLWAWAPWRIFKLRRCCDKLACILPFEKEWFSARKMDVTFVGNPLFDEIDIDTTSGKDYAEFDSRNATVALLPGSRQAELDTLWPAMQEIAIRLTKRWPQIKFVTCAVDDEKREQLKQRQIEGFTSDYVSDAVSDTCKNSDIALVASGSATLQVAAVGCPMVVMYQSSPIMWHLIGRWLIRCHHLSLVNILAAKPLVPEFMPYFKSIDPIHQACNALLSNKTKLIDTSNDLVNLTAPMAEGKASEKTADIAMEMLAE
jgi:lipid-A-disaccharide synthase